MVGSFLRQDENLREDLIPSRCADRWRAEEKLCVGKKFHRQGSGSTRKIGKVYLLLLPGIGGSLN